MQIDPKTTRFRMEKCVVGKRHHTDSANTANTTGKKLSDSALIILMPWIYCIPNKVDGSLPSFLANKHLRDSHTTAVSCCLVIRIGEKKTPRLYTACDKFIYIEILKKAPRKEIKQKKPNTKQTALKRTIR